MNNAPENNEYDLIIIGAGAFGAILSRFLAELKYGGRVLILEKNAAPPQKRWSFWSTVSLPRFVSEVIEKSWPHWSISRNGEIAQHTHSNYHYNTIDSRFFFDQLTALCLGSEKIDLKLNEEVRECQINTDCLNIITNLATYKTHKLVDTRPPDLTKDCVYKPQGMYQCFVGYEIECVQNIFDQTNACIMHDLKAHDTGVDFVYVLPFSKTSALIELTSFNQVPVNYEELRHSLDTYVKQTYKNITYRVLNEETGILPMFNIKKQSKDQRILYAGIAGGSMRASTGYSFLNSVRIAQHQAESLIRSNHFIDKDPIPKHYRLMDEVMLKVLNTSPKTADSLFYNFSSRVSSATYARFMTEKASALDLIKVIAAMPKLPFITACVQVLYENIVRK